MSGVTPLDDFQSRVDDFVTKSLSDYKAETHATEKSIRDAIWGTCLFYAWEVAILDSPLLQRLRDVRQTGLARIIRKRCFLSLVGDRSAITEWWVARFGEVETQGPLSPVA